MYFDLSTMTERQAYAMLTQCVIPRPIAWVLSENSDGGFNVAPFSFFNAVCSDPPLLMISVGRRDDGTPKDTHVNIAGRDQFVVHIIHEAVLPEMNQTAADEAPGVSELERVDLELTAFSGFRLPRIARSRLALACDCHAITEIGNVPQALIFGRVRSVHVHDSILAQDTKGRPKIPADNLKPIGRLGAGEYVTFGDLITLARP